MSDKPQLQEKPAMTVAPVIERNIHTLIAKRQVEEERLGWQEKLAIVVTRFTGSMAFVYLHLLVYGVWIAINLGWIPRVPRFDPSLVLLAMEASVEAIFLSTFILITQNRMMAQADRRADLNLQISLLSEHEVTRLLNMIRDMAKKMGVESAEMPDLEHLSKDVAPEQVLDTIEKEEKRVQGGQ